MVIFNHTNDRGFYRYALNDNGSVLWCLNLIFSISCKAGVPIFFMISGAMLLKRKETFAKTIKRCYKIFFDLIFFSMAYFSTEMLISGSYVDWGDVFEKIVTSNYWHLWYLYAYIAYIITLPFLRKMVQLLSIKDYIYILILSIVILSIQPIIVQFTGVTVNGNLMPSWITANIFIYPVMGYALDNVIDLKQINIVKLAWIWYINLFCFGINEICEYYYLIDNPGSKTETFISNFVIVNASAMFITVKYVISSLKLNTAMRKLITETGKCTFGIYLIHIWLLHKISILTKIWNKFEKNNFGVFLSCVCVFIIGEIIIWMFRNVTALRKLL